jgi:VanZ family protein
VKSGPSSTISTLPRTLAIAYALLIAYACLNPFTGWRDPGLPLFDFLAAPWPRYYTGLDLAFNVLGYVPLGFVLAPALATRMRPGWATLAAILLAAGLSFGLETLQNLLPSRVASNVDLGCNTLGALVGALAGARWGPRLFDRRGTLQRWRQRRMVAGGLGDAGLILFGLWLLAQFAPDTVLFGTGDLRHLLDLPAPLGFDPGRQMRVEAAIAVTNMLAVGLLARHSMRGPHIVGILLLLVLGLAARSLAAVTMLQPPDPWRWATPGAQAGQLVGAGLLLLALPLPGRVRHLFIGLCLLAASALANLLPENPYDPLASAALRGHFLNFHGLAGLTASVWPYLALAYLGALGRLPPEARRPPPASQSL